MNYDYDLAAWRESVGGVKGYEDRASRSSTRMVGLVPLSTQPKSPPNIHSHWNPNPRLNPSSLTLL